MTRRSSSIAAAGLLLLATAPPCARADHHSMQIHKVVAGVNGYTGIQVIQLRMRQDDQGVMTGRKLVAWDAAGLNPVVLVTCDHDVLNDLQGARIVFATDNLASFTTPVVVPDFELENRIPDAYLPAGSLTWENELGNVWWRLCWGGAAYTGPTDASAFNDTDGTCAPPWSGALPSAALEALRFDGLAFEISTTNLADYNIQPGAPTFTTNAGTNTTLLVPPSSTDLRAVAFDQLIASPNPFGSSTRVAFHLAKGAPTRFSVFDVTGRHVATQEVTLGAGPHAFVWGGDDASGKPMPAGVYYLRIQVEEQSRGLPVVLVR